MKILILTLAFVTLATCFKPVNAGEVSVNFIQRSMVTCDDDFCASDWEGFQINYQKNDSYLFISQEQANVSPNSALAFVYEMTGIGFGVKNKLTPTISFVGQIGYYFIENSWGHQQRFNESLHYYINDKYIHSNGRLGYYHSTDFQVINSNAFGATAGIEMNYPLTKSLTLNMGLGYRAMKIDERFIMRRPEWIEKFGEGQWWETHTTRDYGSFDSRVGITYAF